MDASAAIGIVQRQGIIKFRHVEVDVLWIQGQQVRRLMPLRKDLGPRNPSDMGTKNVPAAFMDVFSAAKPRGRGRARAIARQLHNVVETSSGPRTTVLPISSPRMLFVILFKIITRQLSRPQQIDS